MIDTAVAGRPEDVRAAAAWLRAMRSATAASQELLVRARGVAREDWAGSAAEAYAGAGRCLLDAGDRHEQRLLRVAALLEEYADRLAAVQRQMADVRCRAAAGGLVVRGQIVAPPREPQRLALWTQLAEEVARARADHEAWISGRLAPEATRGDDLLGDVREALLQRAAPFLTTAGTVLGARRLGQMAQRMLDAGADARRRAEEGRRARRSGHPGRSAAARRPEAREQRRGLERAAGRAVDLADDARRAARVLGPVGTAVDVVVAADKIRDGASPSETVVSTAAGVAGAVGAAALVSAGAPIVVPALAAGAGAVVASETAGFVWRRLPDGFTEEVDEAAADAWHAGKRFLEDGLDRLVPG